MTPCRILQPYIHTILNKMHIKFDAGQVKMITFFISDCQDLEILIAQDLDLGWGNNLDLSEFLFFTSSHAGFQFSVLISGFSSKILSDLYPYKLS